MWGADRHIESPRNIWSLPNHLPLFLNYKKYVAGDHKPLLLKG